MRTFSAAMIAHLAGSVKTLCFLWDIVRTDGAAFHYTDNQAGVTVGSTTYSAEGGLFSASALTFEEGLNSNTIDVTGYFGSTITKADVLAGKWRNASVTISFCNYSDTTMGAPVLMLGTIGKISVDRHKFIIEIDSQGKALDANYSVQTSPGCRYVFGDPNTCKANISAFTFSGSVFAVDPDNHIFYTTSLSAKASGYFDGGWVNWVTGDNAGLGMEIKFYSNGGSPESVTLQLVMPFPIQSGDTFTIVKGCNKAYGDATNGCASFANQINFGGEPVLPGLDFTTQNVAFIGQS